MNHIYTYTHQQANMARGNLSFCRVVHRRSAEDQAVAEAELVQQTLGSAPAVASQVARPDTSTLGLSSINGGCPS